MSDRLLTTREVAELLAVSTETVLRRHRAGELRSYPVASNAIRFRVSDVEAWLEGLAAGGPSDAGEPAPAPFRSPDPGPMFSTASVPEQGESDGT